MPTVDQMIDALALTFAEELAVKNNAPNMMPLNPTAQGWTGQMVREMLSKAIVGESDSLLSILKGRLQDIKNIFDAVLNENGVYAGTFASGAEEPQNGEDFWFKIVD
jgi:hypothetical protein